MNVDDRLKQTADTSMETTDSNMETTEDQHQSKSPTKAAQTDSQQPPTQKYPSQAQTNSG